MKRIEPRENLRMYPCGMVSIASAGAKEYEITFREKDGYCTLQNMNKAIRGAFNVLEYKYFKRNERPLLKDLKLDKAIVCVLGHYVYLENDSYYSFFENDNDKVVAYWRINNEKN